MVRNVTGQADFDAAIKVPNLVVVDFYGDWCGPCRMIAPVVEEYSRKYPDVVFLKVKDEQCPDLVMSQGIKAFPTFHFYIKGQKVDDMKGADAGALERKIIQWKATVGSSFAGAGVALGGWNGVGNPPGPGDSAAKIAREARLKALESKGGANSSSSSSSSDAKAVGTTAHSAAKPSGAGVSKSIVNAVLAADEDGNDDDEVIARAISESMKKSSDDRSAPSASASGTLSVAQQDAADQAAAEAEFAQSEEAARIAEWGDDMVPLPVNDELLVQLKEMGFSDTRGRKGLHHGNGNLESALVWLEEHENDPDIDQPYMVRKSDVMKANAPPLTAEEKVAKIAELKKKIEQKRSDRAKAEKAEEIRREKQRREAGQKLDTVQEDRERMMRKREAERIKKEKEDEKRERERLRAEIARDKEARRLNKGVLPSVLGVDGYNPSIVQYDSNAAASTAPPAAPVSTAGADTPPPAAQAAPAAAKPRVSPSASAGVATSTAGSGAVESKEEALKKVESALTTISRYRTGGDGGQALKMLLQIVQNIVQNPDEMKYRMINTEGKAYKSRVAPLVGPLILLKAVGFVKNEEEQKLVLDRYDPELLRDALDRIVTADHMYTAKNGSV